MPHEESAIYHAPSAPEVQVNPRVRGMAPSATLAINERSTALQQQGEQVFRLGLGQSPFPVPDFVARALQANAGEKDYLPVRGLPALRAAIAHYHQRTQGLHFDAENILVGPGTKELMFLLQLVHAGELLIPTPSWVSYAPQARILGHRVHWLPTDKVLGAGVTPQAIEAACRQPSERHRLLILNHPGNPTGVSYDSEQLEAIAAAARRHKLLVLSDEIYSGTHFEGRHLSMARFYPEGTIVSDGLSKWCGAGGWRLGAFAFPENLQWLLQAMASVASESYTAVSAPIQHAAVSAFEGGRELEAYLDRSRRILAALAVHVRGALIAAGAECAPAAGGFYLFPNLEPLRQRLQHAGVATSAELCERLLSDTGVAVLPGAAFGRPPAELSLRLAYVDFDGAAALAQCPPEGLPEMAFLQRYCGRVVEATRRMAAWLATPGA